MIVVLGGFLFIGFVAGTCVGVDWGFGGLFIFFFFDIIDSFIFFS